MTPFERAEKIINALADGLSLMGLIVKTLEETEGLSEEESEILWTALLALLESAGRMGEHN